MKANFEVKNRFLLSITDIVLVSNYHLLNIVSNTPARESDLKFIKSKNDIGVWRIKKKS